MPSERIEFVWGPKNTEHVDRHVPRAIAEQVFNAPDFGPSVESVNSITAKGYGTVDGKSYFLAFAHSTHEHPQRIYIITCYRVRRKP